MRNIFKKAVLLFAALLILSSLFSVCISADSYETYENSTYTDYTYWGTGENKKAVAMKSVYTPKLQLGIAELGFDYQTLALEQVCYDSDGNLYILESSEGAVLVFDKGYNFKYSVNEVYYGEEKLDLVGAKGLFINDSGMYICDTANSRVLFCKGNKVEKIITEPEASVIPSDFKFSPIRFVTDERGYGYLLSDGCYYGLMVFTSDYDFIGFFGANKVKSTIGEAVSSWVTSIFDTQEKHEGTVKKLPYLLSDICINKDGYICAVNGEKTGQIRVFAPTGDNILKYNDQFLSGSGDDFNFADEPNSFVNLEDVWLNSLNQAFCAVASDEDGYIYALDMTQGRIYMYDESCNIISVFAGGRKQGSQLGTFVSPNSMDVHGNDIAVIDYVNKNLTVFEITDYGKALKAAQSFTLAGDYSSAEKYWQEVYLQDKNCQLAYVGLAKYYLSVGEYKQAMEYAETGNDKVTYSQCYSTLMNSCLRENLWWICLLVVFAAIAAFAAVRLFKKHGRTVNINPKLNNCFKLMLHPIECFYNIKNYGQGSVLIASAFPVLLYVSVILKKLFSSFMYNRVDLSSFNSIYTLLSTVGLLFLYVAVNWLSCVLFEGKGKKIGEIYCASCYALTPLIISSLLCTVLSYVIVPTGNSGLTLISVLFTAAFVIYLLLSITVIHDFSFFKAIGLMLIIILGIGIVIFVIFATLTLGQDLLGFIIGILKEAALR